MRWSQVFIPTLREVPADAEIASHRLLLRAGYIRQLGAGIYSYLYLAQRSLLKITQIVREEMDRIGCQEMQMPVFVPGEYWKETGQWDAMEPILFRFKDHRDSDYVVSYTHEQIVTHHARNEVLSYRQLPIRAYHFQMKGRDEPRARAGLLRMRQFVMKDSYSFDVDDDGLQRSYDRHREAYIKLFDRLGLPYVIVSAMSGAMGGSASEEFLAPIDVGEDTFVRCTACDYAANTEAVRVPVPAARAFDGIPAARVADTPDTPTIQTLGWSGCGAPINRVSAVISYLQDRARTSGAPARSGNRLRRYVRTSALVLVVVGSSASGSSAGPSWSMRPSLRNRRRRRFRRATGRSRTRRGGQERARRVRHRRTATPVAVKLFINN